MGIDPRAHRGDRRPADRAEPSEPRLAVSADRRPAAVCAPLRGHRKRRGVPKPSPPHGPTGDVGLGLVETACRPNRVASAAHAASAHRRRASGRRSRGPVDLPLEFGLHAARQLARHPRLRRMPLDRTFAGGHAALRVAVAIRGLVFATPLIGGDSFLPARRGAENSDRESSPCLVCSQIEALPGAKQYPAIQAAAWPTSSRRGAPRSGCPPAFRPAPGSCRPRGRRLH